MPLSFQIRCSSKEKDMPEILSYYEGKLVGIALELAIASHPAYSLFTTIGYLRPDGGYRQFKSLDTYFVSEELEVVLVSSVRVIVARPRRKDKEHGLIGLDR